jgi:membrane-bound acyltransferase YfiQ involved in biofilm formation
MYPEKPKRASQLPTESTTAIILVLVLLVPTLLVIAPQFNSEQFTDMVLLTVMISLTIYLVYQSLLILLYSYLQIENENPNSSDSPSKLPGVEES